MFFYEKNDLVLKQGEFVIPIKEIAKDQKTPFYLYDIQGLKEGYQFFLEATKHSLQVFFAMKSNFNKEILKAFQELGSGVDVVSGGEMQLAQSLGFSPQKIIFSGIGKSQSDLEEAVGKKIFQINVESLEELQRLADICKREKTSCSIGLRINPNVDFESHPYIKTGLKGHKFGFEEEDLALVLNFIQAQPSLQLKGLSMHLGSQIFDLDPLLKAIERLRNLYERLKKEKYPLKVLDIGGGLAVNYQRADWKEDQLRVQDFGQALKGLLKGFDDTVITEPGRLLTARFGILCAKVEYIKKSSHKQFAILNSGMNHFLRSALYGTKHRILPLEKSGPAQHTYDVVGPICETGDTFFENCFLPKLKSGDWLAIADTGAYGFVMANRYNLQPEAQEICFDRGQRLSSGSKK